eukprot:4877027-Heterocapsa_arctica.AAC.1
MARLRSTARASAARSCRPHAGSRAGVPSEWQLASLKLETGHVTTPGTYTLTKSKASVRCIKCQHAAGKGAKHFSQSIQK